MAIELARLIGGGTTAPAVDHRLRPIKQLSRLQHIWLEQGKDPGELPVDKAGILYTSLPSHIAYITNTNTIS